MPVEASLVPAERQHSMKWELLRCSICCKSVAHKCMVLFASSKGMEGTFSLPFPRTLPLPCLEVLVPKGGMLLPENTDIILLNLKWRIFLIILDFSCCWPNRQKWWSLWKWILITNENVMCSLIYYCGSPQYAIYCIIDLLQCRKSFWTLVT